jgi:TolB-like protein/class 3 adenylate cyclase/Flp pilus assembly protein TadD
MERPDRLPRKLAAILYADVAGYSRLTGKDEDTTHRRLSEYLDLIADHIARHGGHVMHYAGDAVLAMFDAVADAVLCAAQIQRSLEIHNADLPEEQKVRFRIGVNLGDVIEDRGDIYGDGVNVAARLESLAEPGGICIAGSIHDAVGTRLPLEYEFMGEQQVKNIEQPVRAYSARVSIGSELPQPASISKPKKVSRTPFLTTVASVVLLMVGGVLTWLHPWQLREESVSIERLSFPLANKPSIAVLPFTNISDDPKQEYFVDGITDDLITDIAKLSGLFVIARNSVFTYKGRGVKVAKVAEELGVRYVLEGSVRRTGDQVRINAQLIDAATGGHLWAERYDGTLTNVFDLQDQVTRRIVAALEVKLTGHEQAHETVVETTVPEAYDAFLHGWSHYRRQTPEDFSKARDYFEQALQLDENYSRAHAALAALFWETHIRVWQPALRLDVVGVKKRALQYLDQAMAAPTALALVVGADMSIWRGQFDEAIRQATRAIALVPNDAHAQLELAKFLIFAGQPRDALEFIANAKRLDPHGKARQQYIRGLMEFGMERFEAAAASLENALQLNPDFARPAAILAAVYGHLGRNQDAVDLLRPHQNEYWAGRGVISAVLQFPYRYEEDKQRLAEGLRLGGMKEFY